MKFILIAISILFIAACSTPLQPSILAKMPPPTVAWGSRETVVLSMDSISYDGQLACVFVELEVNDHLGWFMVDSGCNKTWLTAEFARIIGGRASGERLTISGAGGRRIHDATLVDNLDFGFARVHGLFVASGDGMEDLNRVLVAQKQHTVAGILGLDLLVPLGASFDFTSNTISFRKKPNQPSEPTAAAHLER